MSDEEVG